MAIHAGTNMFDLRQRKTHLAKAIKLLENDKIDEEQLRQDVMSKQAESLLRSMYFLESGVYEKGVKEYLSKFEDVILKLKDEEEVSDDAIRKLEGRYGEQTKVIKTAAKRMAGQILSGRVNLNELLDDVDVDTPAVSKYYWGKLLPSMLKAYHILPFVTIKELMNATAANLLIYAQYGRKDENAFRKHAKSVCQNEANMIDEKMRAGKAMEDSETLSEILQYVKGGYIDNEKLRKLVMARKIEQLGVMADAFICERTDTDWARLLISSGNGKELEPIEKFKILAEELHELPMAIGTISLGDSELVKDAIFKTVENYDALKGGDKDTPAMKKEMEYLSEMLSRFKDGQITAGDVKRQVQSLKAEKLHSIAEYFFKKTNSSQYVQSRKQETINELYMEKKETFVKMLSNIQDILLLVNDNDTRIYDALHTILKSVHENKSRESMKIGESNSTNDYMEELMSRKNELSAITKARDAVTETWTISEKKTGWPVFSKPVYTVERNSDKAADSTMTFEELKDYIVGRKSDEIRNMVGSISRKNSEIEKILDTLDSYYAPLADRYLDGIKNLKNLNSEQFDTALYDIIDRVENDSDVDGSALCASLKQMTSNSDKGKMLDSIINNLEETAYGTVKGYFFKKVEGLKDILDEDEFIDAVHDVVTEFEDDYPELIDDFSHKELKWLESNSAMLMVCEKADRELIDKIKNTLDRYPKTATDSITGSKRDELEVLYNRIKIFTLYDKKSAKNLLKQNMPELDKMFPTEAEEDCRRELTKLFAYDDVSEKDLVYAAKKLCDYRIEFLSKKIEELERDVRPKSNELLLKAADYITEGNDYTSLVAKPTNGTSPIKDVHGLIVETLYNFSRDYEIHGMKLDLFAEEKGKK